MPYKSNKHMPTTSFQPMKAKLDSTIMSQDKSKNLTPFGGSKNWYETRNPHIGNATIYIGGTSGLIGGPGPYRGV